jgi:hypothetical protein
MTDVTQRLGGAKTELAFKAPCRVASVANLTLSGYQTINGITFASTDVANGYNTRILVKDQTTASQNGIYVVSDGTWQRARDFDGNNDIVKGTRVYVQGGTVGATTYVVTTADPIVVDTSSITFVTEQSLIGAGVGFEFDGGGAPLVVGQPGYQAWRRMPFPGTITQATLLADLAGTMVIKIYKDTYANWPPTSADSIVASAPPTLTAATKSVDTTLTGWTVDFDLNDILLAEITSTDGIIKKVNLELLIDRSD